MTSRIVTDTLKFLKEVKQKFITAKEKIMKLKNVSLKRFSGMLTAAILTFCMLISALPISAQATAEDTYESTYVSTAGDMQLSAPEETESRAKSPSEYLPINVTLDGEKILQEEAKLISSVTYVPLRRFSELSDADDISWNQSTATATVKKGSTVIQISAQNPYIEANGRCFYTASPILNIAGRLYLPVRLIANAFCIDVSWDAKTRTANLKSTSRVLAKGSDFYRTDDLYWLSRIISAEAGGEPLLGKIAVGNVVLNRREHPSYPSSVYGVVFDRKHGTQFSPVSMGTIYKKPTAESVIAAKICLEGYSLDKEILFFMNPRIATSNWISNTRHFAFRIANHDFYY